MTDTNKTQTGNNKDYSFNATNIVVTHRGVQGKGKNAGKSYLMGSFERKGKDGQPAKQMFKAFDETYESGKGIVPATVLGSIVEGGETAAYITGKFVQGRAKDQNDPSKGFFQDFKVAFVETAGDHAAWVEAKKAEKAAVAA